MLFLSRFSSVQTMPRGLLTASTTISSCLETTFFPTRTSCPGRIFIPVCARCPSTVTFPDSMRRSASRLEHTPASLKYLFSLTGSCRFRNASLISLLTCQHSAQMIVCEKCIAAVEDQRIRDPVCIHNVPDGSAVIPGIHNNDLPVIRRQEGDEAVCK